MSSKLIKSICFAAGITLLGSAYAQKPEKLPEPIEHGMSQDAQMIGEAARGKTKTKGKKVPEQSDRGMSQEAHMLGDKAQANADLKQDMKHASKNKAPKKNGPKKQAPGKAKSPKKAGAHGQPCDVKPVVQDTCSMPK